MENTQTVAAIVEMLGGMKINPETLEWTSDVPVARTVMDSIAEQLCMPDNASVDPRLFMRAALKDIALESQEIQLLKEIIGHKVEPNPDLSGYRLPSEIERETEYIRNEVQILEEETERLTARSRQIKKSSHHMSQSIKSLQDTLSVVRSTNENTMDRIDDLSMQMDGTIADATQAGYSLLSLLEPTIYDGHTAFFETINKAYLAYTDNLTSHLNDVDSMSRTLLEEAGIDIDELETISKRYSPDAKWEDIPVSVREYWIQDAYLAQVEDLCDKMEGVTASDDSSRDCIADARHLVEVEMADPNDRSDCRMQSVVPNARAEIEAAVARDQVTYISSRGMLLDNAISVMEDKIMAPLDNLLSTLSLKEELVRETEVLCGVLGEELEGTMEDTASALAPSKQSQSSAAVLSEHQTVNELGSSHSLKALQDWERELESRQRQFGPGHDGLFEVLNSLNTSHTLFTEAIYANSPLNTSPPFAHPCDLTRLMNDARATTVQLGSETDRLSKEVESAIESRRAQRKLGAFVDQWSTM